MHQIVNKIILESDGVYVSYKNSDVVSKFQLVKAPGLSEIYLSEGRWALARNIIEMLANGNIHIQGKNPTVKKYSLLIKNNDFWKLSFMYVDSKKNHKDFDTELANELLDQLANSIVKTPK